MEVGSDDMSRAVEPFLKHIYELSKLDGFLIPAFSLATQLARCSYSDRDGYYGQRPSDGPADELMLSIAKRRDKSLSAEWEDEEAIDALKTMRKHFGDEVLKERISPKSIKFLEWRVSDDPEAVQERKNRSVILRMLSKK